MSTHKPAAPIAPPASLASADLPPRVRMILRRLFDTASQDLSQALKSALVEFEQQLFRQTEQARSNNRQAEYFSHLHAFQRSRHEFIPHFLLALETELAGIRLPAAELPQEQDKQLEYRSLTLVDDATMDEGVVLSDIARRHESRSSSTLLLSGQRFGVLAGKPAFDQEHLPVGPRALCRMLKEAAACFDINTESKLLLYRAFDRKAMTDYHEWLETLDQLLSDEGVLPGLYFRPLRGRVIQHEAHAARDGTPPAGERPMTGWQAQAGAWPSLSRDMQQNPGAIAEDPAKAQPNTAQAEPAKSPLSSEEAFTLLQELLSNRRQQNAEPQGTPAAGKPHTPPGSASTASAPTSTSTPASASAPAKNGTHTQETAAPKPLPTYDLIMALQTLQASPFAIPASAATGPGKPRRKLKDLQQALLAQARRQYGPQATLARADSDTFELLDMLYGEVEREVNQSAPAAELLTQLQVPLVQVALRDREFFLRPQHPARELLNSVAESGAIWLAENDSDPQLVQKLHQAVDHVVTEYKGDESVFQQANEQIQAHLESASRKAELAERRHVEAARGKDRLETAKQRANDAIETSLQDKAPSKFVEALLRQAWADVLTLTQLRQGEDSDAWREHLHTTQTIISATSAEPGTAPDPALAGTIEKSLLQVGYHQDEAHAIAARLSGAPEDAEAGGTSRTELTARLKARARIGEQNAEKKVLPIPRSPREQEYYDYLRTLPFGTWFEFIRNQQGDAMRKRLSWFSPITDNALFVNQRGQKVGEYSLDHIARLMAQGQVAVVTEGKGRLIDRAWAATLKMLRGLAGNPTTPSPAMGDGT